MWSVYVSFLHSSEHFFPVDKKDGYDELVLKIVPRVIQLFGSAVSCHLEYLDRLVSD